MRALPRHWAVHRETVDLPGRGELDLALWGWSADSPAEAERHARQRWQEVVDRGGPVRGGEATEEYYPRRHLPEEILEEIHDEHGVLVAAVTRNRYGAEVLNTDLLLICDVDFPTEVAREAERAERRPGLLGRLLGRGGAEPDEHALGLPGEGAAREAHDLTLQQVGAFCVARPELGVRVYRTRNGFRLLITGSGLLPGSAGAEELMRELGTDPLYTTLCRVHESYRARLTPKPWRVDSRAPAPVRPWSARERWFAGWLDAYGRASAEVAVCRLIGTHGPEARGIEAELVRRHDAAVRAESGLRLA